MLWTDAKLRRQLFDGLAIKCGVATVAPMVAALAPVRVVVTWIVGKST